MKLREIYEGMGKERLIRNLMENFSIYGCNLHALAKTSLSSGFSIDEIVDTIYETAPPCRDAEEFIKKNKKKFKKRYGGKWKRVLYATAWKIFGKDCTKKK